MKKLNQMTEAQMSKTAGGIIMLTATLAVTGILSTALTGAFTATRNK